MKVVCIDPHGSANGLTENKSYEVRSHYNVTGDDIYLIVDDNKEECNYLASRFISLDLYRKKQLETILK